MSDEIINKVSQHVLLTLDLETLLPQEPAVIFDLKPFLFRELILKEKDFRAGLQTFDWSVYSGKTVGVTCTADAIIPQWAYMLIASYLQPVAADVFEGNEKEVIRQQLVATIRRLDPAPFRDQRVVVKGCGDQEIGAFAYLEIMRVLRPVVKSVMYGEPCSTVPIYKARTGTGTALSGSEKSGSSITSAAFREG